MKRTNRKICAGLLLAAAAALLTYCGESDTAKDTKESVGPPGAIAMKSAGVGGSAASDAVSNATLALSSTVSPQAPRLRSAGLADSLDAFYAGVGAFRTRARAASLASSATFSCLTSGTNVVTLDQASGTLTMSFSDCIDTMPLLNMKHFQNGTVVFSTTSDAVTGKLKSITFKKGDSASPFTDRFSRASDGRVVSESVGYNTLQASVSSSATCTKGITVLQVPQALTFTMTGRKRDKVDVNVDGNFDADATWEANAFTLDVEVDEFYPTTCRPSSGSIRESGLVSATNNLNANGTHTMDISTSKPLTLTFAPGTGGEKLSVSGTLSTTTACFTGALTLATTTELFVPASADCPTAGVVAVSGDVAGTVTFTSSGGVAVSEASGSKTYSSCKGVDACI